MYQNSTVETHWYFFAVTGINITQKLLNTLKDSKDQVYKIDLESPILDHFQAVCHELGEKEIEKLFKVNMFKLMAHFYCTIFILFNKEWISQKRNIMEFNQFLDDIYGL